MIKFIIFTALAFIFAFCISWLFDNNGSILINWLGYEVKLEVITAIIILIIVHYILVIFSLVWSRIFSFSLSKIFSNWTKERKLKILTKSTEFNKKAFGLVFEIIKLAEEGELNKALELQKELAKFISNKDLSELLLAQILFKKGELKKSQDIFSKLKIATKLDFSKKEKQTLASKLQNFFTKTKK